MEYSMKALGIVALLFFVALGVKASALAARTIQADYNKVKGPKDEAWRVCVGACHAALNLRSDWRQQLELIHQECGFEYVRFHGLLDDDMEIYSEDGKGQPVYNWKKLDALYDSILKAGMHPFVELGFMPQALASGTQTIFFYKGNVTPPKSYEKWGALVEALVRHCEERYGRDEVKRWYFEVWNEPNLLGGFWTGSMGDYFKLYEASSKAVKRVCADYQVGGPGTAGGGWIKETLDYSLGLLKDPDDLGAPLKGMNGDYYLGTALGGKPVISRTNETLSFVWNAASPDPKLPKEGYSARWIGELRPERDGSYLFSVKADDGVRAWVDGKSVADDWSDHAAQTTSTLLTLKARVAVPVRIEYYQGGGGGEMHAYLREAKTEEVAQSKAKSTEVKTPIDFISTHAYGTSGHLDEYGKHQEWLVPDINCLPKAFADIQAKVRKSGLPKLPIHITEWSTSYSPRDASHDSYIAAAYILNTLKKSEGLVNSLSYWTFTDIFEEPGLPNEEMHGGFGLLTISSLKKPSFFAYHYMNQLGATELESADASSWVCRSDKGVQILLWDGVMLAQNQKTESNQVFFRKDLKAKASGKARVELSNIPAGAYRLSVHKTGYAANDLFDAYRRMGMPKKPDASQLAILKEATQDKKVVEKMVTVGADGAFKTELPLRQNDVYLIELTHE